MYLFKLIFLAYDHLFMALDTEICNNCIEYNTSVYIYIYIVYTSKYTPMSRVTIIHLKLQYMIIYF